MQILNKTSYLKKFIDREKLYSLIDSKIPTTIEINDILNKALKLKGLELKEVATLLNVKDKSLIAKIMEAARYVKETIYGKRLVLFAPLYVANICSNNCLYCAFRKDNKKIVRTILTQDEIAKEVFSLLKEGHKRILMLSGEADETPVDYFLESIRTAYSVKYGKNYIRRINVEIAPMDVEDFRRLKAEKIGTYTCFQETYDEIAYKKYHPQGGKKSDYEWRLFVMDRAMAGTIDDVGIGALFGLADYRFEVLALIEHANHLEEVFGCGPHTISIPRIEPAEGAPLSTHIPHPVSDEDFKKLVAILRLAVPYTGIILSTRESEELRNELFNYGVSQISAGSRTNPGAYSREGHPDSGAQFSLGDHRSLDEVISTLIDKGYIPSFCTGCYRKGRVGNDFMDLAKPGLIKEFCMPNGVFTFYEYLMDFAKPETKEKGLKLVEQLINEVDKENLKIRMKEVIEKLKNGERDVYF
ncbi:MAG: [FeFe] hydrogenase H-cluster radical SAM maturase HydG [Brevinematales bacterium]|nr:[FeFe] hydrogenase H-cluster radical SAM maturase HydG [Brevinematales bacterium]